MALPDLTGQNIQDTYQRVLQTDSGTLRDGTGSAVTHLTVDGTGSFGRVICTTISASTGQFDANTVTIGNTSFSEVEGEIQFKSGDNFQPIKARTIDLVPTGSSTPSVQISDNGQGFVAVSTLGAGSSIFRAEHPTLTGDLNMGSITQKGSGSFAILLDADAIVPGAGRPDAKFVIESNTPVPGTGTRLFSVSESMEVRSYGHLKVDTNITASGNISASGQIIGTLDGGTF